MEKIVVLTGEADKDDNLINCLKMLFPECNIEVHSKESETRSDMTSSTDHSKGDLLDDKLDKFMSFL